MRLTEFPPPRPRVSNILWPNRGNTKPSMERKNCGHHLVTRKHTTGMKRTEAAAVTLAAYLNESTRYNWTGRLK